MKEWQPLKIDPLSPDQRMARRWTDVGAVMTDDKPYFDTWQGVRAAFERLGSSTLGESGGADPLHVVYRSIAVQAAFVCAAGTGILVLPMFWRRASGVDQLSGVLPALGYVCCLGYGYLALETVLIHELVLFVGHPTYAVTIVILSMLLSSGVGSIAAERIPLERAVGTLRIILAAVVLLGVVQVTIVPALLYGWALGLPPETRMLLVGVALVLVGVQFVSLGLIAELFVATREDPSRYQIRDEV